MKKLLKKIGRALMKKGYRDAGLERACFDALARCNHCPGCGKSFGPQYSLTGNKPAEMICNCDRRGNERRYRKTVNYRAINEHIAAAKEGNDDDNEN